MQKKRCEEGGGLLRECELTHRVIGESLDSINTGLRELHVEVREMRDQSIRSGESLASVWHVLKEDVKPSLIALTNSVTTAVRVHAEDCPARRRMLGSASAPSPAPTAEVDKVTLPKLNIPHWAITVGAIIGAAIATAIITIMTMGSPSAAKTVKSPPPIATPQ